MTEVDPFVLPIPQKFLDDPETAEWARFLHLHLEQLWLRTGGSIDQVSDNADAVDGVVSDDEFLNWTAQY